MNKQIIAALRAAKSALDLVYDSAEPDDATMQEIGEARNKVENALKLLDKK